MNFLTEVKHLLCHEPCHMQVVQVPGGHTRLRCAHCQNVPIPNIYEFIFQCSHQDLMSACHLAQLYHAWTGDHMIPVPFAIVGIQGILSKRIDGQPLYRLQASIQLLKALNAPFTDQATIVKPEQDFLTDYLQAIEHAQHQEPLKPNEKLVLMQLVKNFHKLVDTQEFKENKFDFYFDKLVPYVKACHEAGTLLPADNPQETNLVMQLKNQLLRSQAIRQVYGKFSIPFDIFHVLVSCYACCADIDAVANWALDFMARLCRGEYFWKQFDKSPFVEQVLRILKTEVTYKRNTDLYYVIKQIQQGDGIECLSENMDKYGQLEKLIQSKLHVPADMMTMVTQQMFPSVVFDSHWHQLAFTIAMSHVAYSIDPKTGQVKKGTFAKARRMYRDIYEIVKLVQAFDAKVNLPWTVDTLKLLMVSDANLEKRLTDMVGNVFDESAEDE